MKIYNTSCFEKLKIRPVNIHDLETDLIGAGNGFTYRKLSSTELESLDVDNIKDGWIFTTLHFVWIKINRNLCIEFFNTGYSHYSSGAIVRPCLGTSSGLSFLAFDTYHGNFPINANGNYTIQSVYETNINISIVSKPNDNIEIYEKYKINDIIKPM